jgi:hypothetical protein
MRDPQGVMRFSRTDLAPAYARAGRRFEAQQLLDQFTSARAHRYVSPLDLALICVAPGDTDVAFQHLDRAYEGERPCCSI